MGSALVRLCFHLQVIFHNVDHLIMRTKSNCKLYQVRGISSLKKKKKKMGREKAKSYKV